MKNKKKFFEEKTFKCLLTVKCVRRFIRADITQRKQKDRS